MSDPALYVESLSKKYTIGTHHRHNTLRDQIAYGFRSLVSKRRDVPPRENTFWAVKDISFQVEQGDVLGIIGRNGAGKSTLLKILSRITEPTHGRARIFGRVGSLLEVGTGFHPELTGRENVYLNGAILGMRKAEINRKFDEIVAFAAIEKFIDTPVKRYSSGMYVRLAFAVAAHLEPEVLIVDEVLAVGDAGFQKKCLGRMEGVAREGRTVLFVSHNMAAVEHLCNKALLLNAGRVIFSGSAREATDQYIRGLGEEHATAGETVVDLRAAPGRPKKFRPLLNRVEISTANQPVNGCIRIGAPLEVRVSFRLEKPAPDVHIVLGFHNERGQRVFMASSTFQPNWPEEKRDGEQTYVCEIPSFTLVPGAYGVKIMLDASGVAIDSVWDAIRVTVMESDYYGTGKLAAEPSRGFFVLEQRWRIQ
jgi:lipopolysaccharide transport system ATP-binding protein